MAGRLSRFLNLERKRRPDPAPPHEVVSPGRFEPRPEIELSPDHGAQPFLRCPSCEADNSRHAASCVNCGGQLDTTEVSASQPPAGDQRALGEAIAREVAVRERARLGIPDRIPARVRLAMIAAALCAVLALAGHGRPLLRVAGAALAIALAAWVKGLRNTRFRD